MTDLSTILALRPKLSDGEFVVPQPSLEELIREHYRRIDISGDGQILADRHIAVLADMAASNTSAKSASGPKTKPEPSAEPAPDPAVPSRSPFDFLSDVGLDLKIGGVDISKGVKDAIRDGNPAPIIAGLAGLMLGAMGAGTKNNGKA